MVFIESLPEPLESCAWDRGGVGSSLVKDVCVKFKDLFGGYGCIFVWVAFFGGEG